MTMTRRLAIGAAVLLAVSTGGCGGSAVTNAVLNSTVSPNPVTAQAPGQGDLQWSASFTLTLTERAGLGATVTATSAAVYEASGGIVTATLASDKVLIQANATDNRVPASGSLPIDYKVSYTTPSGGRAVLVRITFAVTDDNGLSTTGFVDVNVV